MLYTQTSHPHTLTLTRASAAGTAGTVLGIPIFGRLTISRRGLAIRSGGSGTHMVALNWCGHSTCMQLIRNSRLFTFCCPGTSSDSSPAICRIRFSIASLQYRLLSFCYVTDDMESRSQWQCSAKHNNTMRAHPDNRKMKAKNSSALCAERSPLHASIHCLRQWP